MRPILEADLDLALSPDLVEELDLDHGHVRTTLLAVGVATTDL